MLMADGGGGGGWIPAFNAIVAGAAQAVERAISTPYRAAYDPGWISYLEDKAAAERQQLIADRQPRAGHTSAPTIPGPGMWPYSGAARFVKEKMGFKSAGRLFDSAFAEGQAKA